MVSQEQRKAIALDLVNKYPKGPNGVYRRKHYETPYKWHWLFDRYTDVPTLTHTEDVNKEWFGYDPTFLFALEIDSEYDARRLLRAAYEDAPEKVKPQSDSAMSRRARLLYYRVKNATDHVRRHGGQGVYEIRWGRGWGDQYPKAYIPANTKFEAKAVGDMLRGLYGVPHDVETGVNYHAKAEAVATLGLNSNEATKIREKANEHVEELMAKLEKAKAHAEKMSMVSMMIYDNALSMAGVGEEEDAE